MKKIIFALLFCFLLPATVFAWSGFDYEKANYIDIDEGTLVRRGETIFIFDYDDANYKLVEVENITRAGNHVEVEVYDPETEGHRTLVMDGD